MQLVPPVLGRVENSNKNMNLSEMCVIPVEKFLLPVHEDDAIAKSSVTHTPNWNGFRKDADGRVLEVDATPWRRLRHVFTLEFRGEETHSQSYLKNWKKNDNKIK